MRPCTHLASTERTFSAISDKVALEAKCEGLVAVLCAQMEEEDLTARVLTLKLKVCVLHACVNICVFLVCGVGAYVFERVCVRSSVGLCTGSCVWAWLQSPRRSRCIAPGLRVHACAPA